MKCLSNVFHHYLPPELLQCAFPRRWSLRTFLYWFAVTFPFKGSSGLHQPASESHHALTVRVKYSGLCRCLGVSYKCAHPFVVNMVKDGFNDQINSFHIAVDHSAETNPFLKPIHLCNEQPNYHPLYLIVERQLLLTVWSPPAPPDVLSHPRKSCFPVFAYISH